MITNKKFSIIVFFIFIIIFLFVSIPSFFIYKILLNSKEDLTIQEVVKFQLENDAVYNSLDMNTFQYKLELIKHIKPKVIALGSSRVMQFREESFNTNFITTGGAMNYLNEGYLFLQEMIKIHKPEIIILGLDLWWFNDNYNQPNNFNHINKIEVDIKNKINTTFSRILKKELDLNMFFSFKEQNYLTNYENIGLNSIKYSNGFRKDGSYHYSLFILGDAKNSDIKFSNTFNRVDNGSSRFKYGNHISKERVEIFNDILKFTKDNNIKLILFIPPLANEVVERMDNLGNKYNFVIEFRNLIKNSNIENYDFHDMRDYYKNSCEFVDGFHGGDVAYQRILKKMYDENSSLSKYLNIEFINKSIEENEGKTLTIFDKSKYKKIEENDYLELGCIK
ncbi:hypothetical protein [Aliarcobacter cryaerophilus]|uniref:Uncharacterized protein n=1 Tax=Aliarcobacter cryaerophilus TaxID=28198 RepID=A0A2S9TJQ5_9BACT|nr:hypothetical protein [Aliarcobacter cryaerophilus]PRM99032.1 hypothetical protein CJ670_01500 [Arcobacter cryaerophilus gv. crypticus]